MDVTFAFALAVAGIALAVLAVDRVPPSRRRLALVAAALLVAPALPALATVPPPILRLPFPGTRASSLAEAEVLAPAPGGSYVVVPGDTLSAIARRALEAVATVDGADVGRYWREIHAANRDVIGANPHLIFPGQSLDLPVREAVS